MSITVPDKDERALLTEGDIDYLVRGGRDTSLEWSLALGGAGLGFLQNIITVLTAVGSNKSPSMLDMLLSAICVACIAGAVSKFSEHKKASGDLDTFVKKLKAGRKIQIKG